MKQLEIRVVKDTTISALTCSPNVILLAKQSTTSNAKTGETTNTVRYIEVCNVEKTDGLTIVQTLLIYCIAEYYTCTDLEKDFADTKIKQKKLFNQFLTGDTIYRTNSDGKVCNALVSEVPLSQTALKIKDYHAITTCKKENRKAAIYQHAKAILAQCKYLRLILDKVETLKAEQTEQPKQKEAKPEHKKVTAPKFAAVPQMA